MEEPLKSIFCIKKKPYDVFLNKEEITWTPQAAEQSGTAKKMYNLQARSLLMRDVIGALIRKKKSSKKSNSPGKLLGLTVCTYCKEGDRKLAESRLSFESDDLELCQLWSSTINENLKGLHGRPSKLKVFINPHSKKGKAPMVYDSLVAPLFRKAGIKTDVITTERAGHAWELLSKTSLECYDGVVCVGGDGIVHEVVNGLLEKHHLNHGIDIINDALPNDFEAIKLDIPVGIIPAGSTDVIINSAQGVNDPVTSAIHIILGHSQTLDICSLENANRLIRFSFSAAYGFLGDVLKSSERSRWMGPSRYKWAAAKRMCKLRSYDVEINYLLSTNTNCHPRDNQRCRTGCEVCSGIESPAETFEEWKTFKGSVVGVSLITLPSPCDISPDGPSPCCHLGDGYTDMIIVRSCSPKQMYSHVKRNFNSKDQFDFDFVDVSRVKQCHIRAITDCQQQHQAEETGSVSVTRRSTLINSASKDRSVGIWNVDGELLDEPSVLVRVHRQLITVFGQGIPDIPLRNKGCLPLLSSN